jgi:hypothetical protein
MSNNVRFYAGVDWATEADQVCLVDAGGRIIGERAFAHGGVGLAEMCGWLETTSGAEPSAIAVAIETPHGPVVEDPARAPLPSRCSQPLRDALCRGTP